jgi:PAS domain S-box-containing protein
MDTGVTSCHGSLARVDALLPAWIRGVDAETRGRARLLLSLVVVIALLGATSGLAQAIQGHRSQSLLLIGCSAAALATLAIPARSGRLRGASSSFCTILFVALVGTSMLAGAPKHAPIGAAMIPFLATMLGGRSVGLVWTGLVVVALGLLALATSGDPVLTSMVWQTAILTVAIGLGSALFELVRVQARNEALESLERKAQDHSQRDRERTTDQAIRELFKTVFSQAPAILVLSDFDSGRIQNVNESFERLLGWTLEEARGRTLTELNGWSSPDDRHLLSEHLLRDGLSKNVEIPLRTRSGDTLWMWVTASRIELEGRSHLLAQGIDITQRKRAERALEQTRTQLEERVSRRTEELEESRNELRRQRQLATVGNLAAGIAHQINNPIASIKAAAEYALLMSDAPDSNAVRMQALRTAIAEADRCGRIVRNVLKFSRREPTARWVEDLNEIVQRAATLIRPYLEQAGGSLELRTHPTPLPTRISPIEVEQAVVHLLRNAAEALEGGGEIQLSTRRREDVVEIEIADDGRGIPPEDRERVLQPFYTTRLALGGTGLGLSFVHDVIREHGGELRIESTPEKGTRIRIQLPLV